MKTLSRFLTVFIAALSALAMVATTCCAYDTMGMFPEEANKYYTEHPEPIVEGGSTPRFGLYVYSSFDEMTQMFVVKREKIEGFRSIAEKWEAEFGRCHPVCGLEYNIYLYLSNTFWLPNGYTADDIIYIGFGTEAEIIFKDRTFLHYKFTDAYYLADELKVDDDYGFVLYETGIGENNREDVAHEQVEVYNLYDTLRAEGWKEENGKKFYINADGQKVTGFKVIDGVGYTFTDEGDCKGKYTGYTKSSKGRRYYKDGVVLTNCWLKVNGECKYFASENGWFLSGGWHQIGIREYRFDDNGVLVDVRDLPDVLPGIISE